MFSLKRKYRIKECELARSPGRTVFIPQYKTFFGNYKDFTDRSGYTADFSRLEAARAYIDKKINSKPEEVKYHEYNY